MSRQGDSSVPTNQDSTMTLSAPAPDCFGNISKVNDSSISYY